MTLRTALVIDGDATGAVQATGQAAAGLGQLEGASERAALAASQALARVQQQTARQAAQIRQGVLFQLNDIGVSLASGMNPLMVALQQGSQLATGPGGLAGALKETGNIAVSMATRFWPIGLAVGAATAAIGGMQAAINSAGDEVEVSFGDTALAVLQTFGDYIWDAIEPAVTAISGWFADAWNATWPVIKTIGNTVIGTFTGAFDAVTRVWSTLPAVFADIFTMAMNGAIDIVQNGINGIVGPLSDLMKMAGMEGLQLADLSGFKGQITGAAGEAGKIISDSFGKAYGTDHLGGFFSDVADRARQNAQNRLAEDGKAKKAKAETDKLTSAVNAQRTAWDELGEAGASAFDRLTDSVLSGGKDILSTIQSIGGDFAKMAFQMAITNPLKNLLFGGNATTFGGSNAIGAGGGIFGALMGIGGIGGLKSSPGLGGLTGSVMSFAGGGSTGRGPRSGGMDGMGGFLAMLHPEETVVDHTAGGGRASQPVFNFYDAPRQPDVKPNGQGGFDFFFGEIDRRLSDGRMGKGFATRHGLTRPQRRS